jgi:hypothetical protein
MNQTIKNLTIFFFCLSLIISTISVKINESNYIKEDFPVFSALSSSFPVDFPNQGKKNHSLFNYNRFNLKNLIKTKLFKIVDFIVLIFISFLTFINFFGLFKVNFKKKKHYIAKYVEKVYNTSVLQLVFF